MGGFSGVFFQENMGTEQERLTCNKGPQPQLSEGNLAFWILDNFNAKEQFK